MLTNPPEGGVYECVEKVERVGGGMDEPYGEVESEDEVIRKEVQRREGRSRCEKFAMCYQVVDKKSVFLHGHNGIAG